MNCTHFKLLNVTIYCCSVPGNWLFWSATVRGKKIVLRLCFDQQTAPQDNVSLLGIFKENRGGLPLEASTCSSISDLAGQVC